MDENELVDKVAQYLIALMFVGAKLGIENSSLRNMAEDDYYNINKDEWQIRSHALIDMIQNWH